MLIPKDHKFRRFLSLVDFSFVYDELKSKYCPNNGRAAIDPVMMFKYLVLKAMSICPMRSLLSVYDTAFYWCKVEEGSQRVPWMDPPYRV